MDLHHNLKYLIEANILEITGRISQEENETIRNVLSDINIEKLKALRKLHDNLNSNLIDVFNVKSKFENKIRRLIKSFYACYISNKSYPNNENTINPIKIKEYQKFLLVIDNLIENIMFDMSTDY